MGAQGYLKTCTESSNSSRSAIQSGLQRNQAEVPNDWQKSPHFRNLHPQTGAEKVSPGNSINNLSRLFLQVADSQSGFDGHDGRTQSDHRPMIRRKSLDFANTSKHR
jgi:hypothetical protein